MKQNGLMLTLALRTIGFFLLMVLLSEPVLVWADIVENKDGTVYRGTIIKMDENEVVIRTISGTTHIPRSNVRSFQSEPPPAATSSSQSSTTQKRPDSGLGESAKQALRGLKKLEARCQAGISYRDYGRALGEAKFETNLFLESQEAKKNSEFTKALYNAMEHYETASTVWKQKFRGEYSDLEFTPSSPIGTIILKTYPELNKNVNQGGALLTLPDRTVIMIDRTLPFIWGEASKELKRAAEIYSN